MNILIISAVFPPEPVVSANISRDLAMCLSQKGDITVICPKPSRPKGFNFSTISEYYNFNLLRLNSFTSPQSSFLGRMYESFDFGIKCSRYIKDNHNEMNVIYANTWPLFAQYLNVRIARRNKIKIVTHVQDIYPESLLNKLPAYLRVIGYKLLLPLDKYILASSDKVVAISEKMSTYLIRTRKLNADNVFVVNNYQDVDPFLKFNNNKPSIGSFTFMYLGNIGPVAGIDLIIDAFKLISKKGTKLCIAGSGSMREFYKSRVNNEKIDNIEFIDVPEGMVPEIQSRANVMILPMIKGTSLSSIPSKLPAYMFSCKPIIACVEKESETGETILKSKCGWVIPPDDKFALSEKMIELINQNKEALDEIGQNGFDYASQHFSRKKNLERLVEIIVN